MKKIDSSAWKPFKIGGDGGLFEIEFCLCGSVGTLLEGDIPYVGAAKVNNGVQKYVADQVPSVISKGGCIVFICNGQGSVGYALYQPEDFIGTKDLKVGRNPNLNEFNGLFIVAALDKNREIYGYSFAEKRTLAAMEREEVWLPATEDGKPDWDYMTAYMQETMERESWFADAAAEIEKSTHRMNDAEWCDFDVEDLFENVTKAMPLTKAAVDNAGTTPVYSTLSSNNGIMGYTSLDADYRVTTETPLYVIFGEHTRTLNIADADFCVLDNVKVLVPKIRNVDALLFTLTAWRRAIPFEGYARHWSLARVAKVRLPVTPDGQPDTKQMAAYMRAAFEHVRPIAEELVRLS